jgi:hypothetical protein
MFKGSMLFDVNGQVSERILATAQEYRDYAAACMAWAKTVKSDSQRNTYLEMASAWLQVARLKEPLHAWRENPLAPAPKRDAEED